MATSVLSGSRRTGSILVLFTFGFLTRLSVVDSVVLKEKQYNMKNVTRAFCNSNFHVWKSCRYSFSDQYQLWQSLEQEENKGVFKNRGWPLEKAHFTKCSGLVKYWLFSCLCDPFLPSSLWIGLVCCLNLSSPSPSLCSWTGQLNCRWCGAAKTFTYEENERNETV